VGNTEIAIGNLVGSNIRNIFSILGIAAIIDTLISKILMIGKMTFNSKKANESDDCYLCCLYSLSNLSRITQKCCVKKARRFNSFKKILIFAPQSHFGICYTPAQVAKLVDALL
jgi:hypothetical protein